MLLIDRRAGSIDIVQYLPKGTPYELTLLDGGDVAFMGMGTGDTPVLIGVEVKKLDDVINCIHDGRFAGEQLPKLKPYDYVWLVIQGDFRVREGVMEVYRGGQWKLAGHTSKAVMFNAFDSWIRTMEVCAGIRVSRTRDSVETAETVTNLYRWWRKGLDNHRSHLAFYEPPPQEPISLTGFEKPGIVRRVAKEFEGIGWERSKAVAEHFQTVYQMVTADEKEWRQIYGIGKGIAQGVVAELGSTSRRDDEPAQDAGGEGRVSRRADRDGQKPSRHRSARVHSS